MWQLIIAGILVHLVLFYSIFDIYFTSPLVHGMTPVQVSGPAPARRLVLFVADGLRADKFYEDGPNRTPFLREVIEKHGAWGVSHTRVPTESRPGHVALIAGFYEDVSAVAKGWKENPVEFDSVFNESRHTWSWGSSDILPMFSKGASGDHVTTYCYPSSLEDFAGSDMTVLDTWVFDQVKSFFESASRNSTLAQDLNEDKLIFFLHLLGIDTHGHADKPHSREYLNNIQVVDSGIREIVSMIDKFYHHDGLTSYVLTADHGMTDWGSHGAGHAHETLTPFVVWGSGIRQPIAAADCGEFTDSYCADWHLEMVKRIDVEQADIAPLMAVLLGLPLPMNSVGRLPVDVLSATEAEKAEALLANAVQILAQLEVKMRQVQERTLAATFQPFQELMEGDKLQLLKEIRNLITGGQYQKAISQAQLLIKKGLSGLRYYQTYDRFFLGLSVVLGFLGWMTYIFHLILQEHVAVGSSCPARCPQGGWGHLSTKLFALGGAGVAAFLYVQSSPAMYYVYCLMPVFLWYKAVSGLNLMWKVVESAARQGSLLGFLVSILFCIAGLEVVIQSFFHRELLSLCLVGISLWPWTLKFWTPATRVTTGTTRVGWCLSCLLVAVFPLLPVVGRDTHYHLVLLGGAVAIITSVYLCLRQGLISRTLFFQILLLVGSELTVYLTSSSIRLRRGLPLLCQNFSWFCLALSYLLPLWSPTRLKERLASLSLSFFASYLLMSITYEAFFFLSLLALLYFWLKMEFETSEKSRYQKFEQVDFKNEEMFKDHLSSDLNLRNMELSDLRRAFLFIFFVLTAFFGTGNIASINSFNPASVYCFLTVFSPFLMGGLMLIKILIPFLIVTCTFRGVTVVTRTPLRALFLVVLIMSDFMGLHFFFFVRDSGSWLEIGTTISHYIIVMVMILFLLLLTGTSYLLTCCRILNSGLTRDKVY